MERSHVDKMINDEMDNLCEDMETLMVDDMDEERYLIKRDLEMRGAYDIGDIEMSCLQVWCLFGMPEGVMKKRYYEYRIDGPNSNFIICSVGERFMAIKRWRIVSETLDEKTNGMFMRHLERGLRCYDEYYRSIERGVYESSDREVDEVMKEIMGELQENIGKLRRM